MTGYQHLKDGSHWQELEDIQKDSDYLVLLRVPSSCAQELIIILDLVKLYFQKPFYYSYHLYIYERHPIVIPSSHHIW